MEATFSPRFPRDTAARYGYAYPAQHTTALFSPRGSARPEKFFWHLFLHGHTKRLPLGWPQMPKRPTFPTRPAPGPCPPRQTASQVLLGTACGHPAAPLRHKTPQQPARMQVSVPPANIPARYPVQYPEAAAWTPRPFGTRPSSVPHLSAILSARAPSVPPKRTCPGPSQPQEFSHDC